MKKLIVDREGRIMIPSHLLERHGLCSGDELTLIEAEDGLLIYQHGLIPLTKHRLSSLSEEERRQALR